MGFICLSIKPDFYISAQVFCAGNLSRRLRACFSFPPKNTSLRTVIKEGAESIRRERHANSRIPFFKVLDCVIEQVAIFVNNKFWPFSVRHEPSESMTEDVLAKKANYYSNAVTFASS